MIIGVIGTRGNIKLYPNEKSRFLYNGSSHINTYCQLYPSDFFYYIDVEHPDMNYLNEVDIVYYQSGTIPNPFMSSLIDRISVPIVTYLEGGLDDIIRSCISDLCDFRYIMDKSTVISFGDREKIKTLQLFTTTKVDFIPLPYPFEYVKEYIDNIDHRIFGRYDIFIPYGISSSHGSSRNGIFSVLVCNEFIKSHPDMTVLVIEHSDINISKLFCNKFISNNNFTFRYDLNCYEYLSLMYGAKLILSLDRRMVSGRNAIDASLMNKSYIGSNLVPDVKEIYGGINDVFDIDSVLNDMDKSLVEQPQINTSIYEYLSYDYARKKLEELL